MKSFRRILIFAGAIFLILQGTGTRVGAQYGSSDRSCCAQDQTHTTSDLPCGHCTKGPAAGNDQGTCSYAAFDEAATSCDQPNSGNLSKFEFGSNDCQLVEGGSTCMSGPWGADTCPTSYTVSSWEWDPGNCIPAPPGCAESGYRCRSTSDCCSPLQCLGYPTTCQPCPFGGLSCTPPGASSACGTYACDGSSCSPECSYDGNCWQNGVQGRCVSGCCSYSGGCASDSGNNCGSCGTIQCDGSCNDPCGCAWGVGSGCGLCGTVQCDNSCNDPCSNAGGGGGGGGGGDPCATAGCPEGCETWCDMFGCWPECYDLMDPVILSLDGSLFPLTNAANGLRFDFYGNNKPLRISWTAAGAKIGWLAMDLNRDGLINNGLELFSNATHQPGKAGTHLGFRALAQWDKPAMGGNGDGQITSKDYVFSRLRVWVDSNHNGISEPGELLTMEQAGIKAISLQYLPDNWTDQYGNRFQNRAKVTWSDQNHGNGKGQGSGGGKDQWAYDVVLLSTKPK